MHETVLEEHCVTETIEQEQCEMICSYSLDMDPDHLGFIFEHMVSIKGSLVNLSPRSKGLLNFSSLESARGVYIIQVQISYIKRILFSSSRISLASQCQK